MKVSYVELLGQKHPLCFSIGAYEEIGEIYGTMDNMQAEIAADDMVRAAKATEQVLQLLLKAGRSRAKTCGEELPEPISYRIGDLIDIRDGRNLIIGCMKADTERKVRTTGNAEATQGN